MLNTFLWQQYRIQCFPWDPSQGYIMRINSSTQQNMVMSPAALETEIDCWQGPAVLYATDWIGVVSCEWAALEVICRVCTLVRPLWSFVVTSCNYQINTVINPNLFLQQLCHNWCLKWDLIELNCWVWTHVMNDLGRLGTSDSHRGKAGIQDRPIKKRWRSLKKILGPFKMK